MVKLSIALALSICGPSAQAAALICENVRGGVFEEHVTLKTNTGSYEISHSGQSRNSYEAIYVVRSNSATRFGTTASLQKVEDHSTWKDMPEKLTLDHHFDGEINAQLRLYGLTGANAPAVLFELKDCVSVTVAP